MKNQNSIFIFTLMFVLLAFSTVNIFAADGDLDTSFDGDGRVVTDLLADDNASEIVQLPDGKLLVYGLVGTASFNGFARYNADGTLDATFGNGGKVVLDQPQGRLNAVKVQPDGKIVGATFDGYLVRLNANGSLNTTLDSGNPNQQNGFRRLELTTKLSLLMIWLSSRTENICSLRTASSQRRPSPLFSPSCESTPTAQMIRVSETAVF